MTVCHQNTVLYNLARLAWRLHASLGLLNRKAYRKLRLSWSNKRKIVDGEGQKPSDASCVNLLTHLLHVSKTPRTTA